MTIMEQIIPFFGTMKGQLRVDIAQAAQRRVISPDLEKLLSDMPRCIAALEAVIDPAYVQKVREAPKPAVQPIREG